MNCCKKALRNETQASSPATDIYWHSDIDNWPEKMPVRRRNGNDRVAERFFKTWE
jgi:hypothetical protein